MAQDKNKKELIKKVRKGDKSYPIATVAFYGPNSKLATEMVSGILKYEGVGVDPIKSGFRLMISGNQKKRLVNYSLLLKKMVPKV